MAGSTVDTVVATVAAASDRPVLDRLLQLYLHDFSEFAQLGSPFGEVNEAGLFSYTPPLDIYWQDPTRIPLLIRADGHIAGFVLVSQWSALGRPLDRAVAEFFVLRKYRLANIGTRIAHLLFRRYPGRWEVPVAEYNPGALRFWRSVVGSLGVAEVTEQAGDGQRWSGTVLCFDSRSAP